MVPSGIYHKDEVKDSANFYAVQVGIRSGADKDFEEQLENGIRLDKEHYLRIFPVWFSLREILPYICLPVKLPLSVPGY